MSEKDMEKCMEKRQIRDSTGLKSDIQNFVAECLVCKQNNVEKIKTLGLLQPLSIPSQRLEEVSMDFIISLPSSKGRVSSWW